ncbi:YfiR/HmsC family protein [uncultured Dokdonia sp.]|uniref:YfiR/HmsC family protein n=1 Tax=uncultured Dokdonia sp. TaxID=575653 RepID=UPI00262976B0|nr:YfiR/HmsC family protein [uncultured Dokdonia sp.]
MRNKNKIGSIISILFVLLLSLQNVSNVYAQGTDNKQVERLQRAIFVYNIAHQVVWPNANDFNEVTIGVLGPDRTAIDLQGMAQKRRIGGKPVKVITYSKVKDIGAIQILYVNNRFHYDIAYILQSIKGKNILLITEDYSYNASMINMVSVGNSFEYEINESLLSIENFNIAPSLSQNAISSAQKWKALFKETQSLLEKEKTIVSNKDKELLEKDTLLKNQQDILNTQKDTISQQEKSLQNKERAFEKQLDSIDVLWSINQLQEQKYEDKVAIEKALEKQITEQVAFSKSTQNQIIKSQKQLKKQDSILAIKNNQITAAEKIIDTQESIITSKTKINTLLGLLAGLLLLGGVYFFINYRKKRALNATLASKNTEIYKQSKALSLKNNELEQFAYIASHDLKEPLNTISSLIMLIKDDAEDTLDPTILQNLEFMDDSSTRMRALIETLLQHSKLGAMTDVETIDCNALLEDLQKDLSTVIKKNNAVFHIDQLPAVKASKVELRLVFQNLLANAMKFRKADTSPIIKITYSKDADEAFPDQYYHTFYVTDNGIGIPEIHQEKIFTIFQRLHADEAYEGTGIGLAHTKKIIQAHGGSISVESAPGHGSTFSFTLPV